MVVHTPVARAGGEGSRIYPVLSPLAATAPSPGQMSPPAVHTLYLGPNIPMVTENYLVSVAPPVMTYPAPRLSTVSLPTQKLITGSVGHRMSIFPLGQRPSIVFSDADPDEAGGQTVHSGFDGIARIGVALPTGATEPLALPPPPDTTVTRGDSVSHGGSVTELPYVVQSGTSGVTSVAVGNTDANPRLLRVPSFHGHSPAPQAESSGSVINIQVVPPSPDPPVGLGRTGSVTSVYTGTSQTLPPPAGL